MGRAGATAGRQRPPATLSARRPHPEKQVASPQVVQGAVAGTASLLEPKRRHLPPKSAPLSQSAKKYRHLLEIRAESFSLAAWADAAASL